MKTGTRRKAPAKEPVAARRRGAPKAHRERGITVETAGFVQHEALLRAVIENIPIVLWSVDRRGVFTYHDGKGLDGAGLARGQHLGKSIFELYNNAGMDGVRRALAGEPHHSFSEAHGVHWESWLMPVRADGGEVTSVIGFTLDVTETKRVEQELRAKLDLIERQQQVIRELSTPIIEVWEGVLTLPMVGVVDTVRTSEVMENLLSRIVETGARFAILDLTGVEVVDTKVASHLISLVSAIRLLGAEGVITGIKPTVAQTMVALGLDLSTMVTHANLRAGLKFCIQRMAKGARPG
jgi:rsbT co-antagonist protein RsbR